MRREDGHVKVKTEVAVIRLQVTECQRAAGSNKISMGKIAPQSFQKEPSLTTHLFQISSLQTMRK